MSKRNKVEYFESKNDGSITKIGENQTSYVGSPLKTKESSILKLAEHSTTPNLVSHKKTTNISLQ